MLQQQQQAGGSGSAAVSGASRAMSSGAVAGLISTSNPPAGSAVAAGAGPSAAASLLHQPRSMSAGNIPIGSALNATRATHNNNNNNANSTNAASNNSNSSNNSFGGGGGAASSGGGGGVTATGSLLGGGANPYAPFISGGGGGSGVVSANNSNPNSARGGIASSASSAALLARRSQQQQQSGGAVGSTSATDQHQHQQHYHPHHQPIAEEEDYSRAQVTAPVAALRATNVVSPSGMTSEQTQRFAAMLSGTAISKLSLLAAAEQKKSTGVATDSKGRPVLSAFAKASGDANTEADTASDVLSALRSGRRSNTTEQQQQQQLVVGEVQTRLRLFDLFHFWSALPETQTALKAFVEEATAAMKSGAPAVPLPSTGGLAAGGQSTSSSSLLSAALGGPGSQQTSPRVVGMGGGAAGVKKGTAAGGSSSLGITGSPLLSSSNNANTNNNGGPLEDSGSSPVASASLAAEANLSPAVPSLRAAAVPPPHLLHSGGSGGDALDSVRSGNSNSSSSAAAAASTAAANNAAALKSARSQAGSTAAKQMNREASYRSLRVGQDGGDANDDEDDALPLMNTQREEATVEAIVGVVSSDSEGEGGGGGGGGGVSGPPTTDGPLGKGEDTAVPALSGGDFSLAIGVTPPSGGGGGGGGPIPSTNSPVAGNSPTHRSPRPSAASALATSPAAGGGGTAANAHRHAKSPRSGHVSLPCPPSATASLEGSLGRIGQAAGAGTAAFGGFHIVDEVDAAHARGGLSPRVGSLIRDRQQLSGSGGETGRSLDGSFRAAAAAGGDVSGDGPLSITKTPLTRSAVGTPNRARSPSDLLQSPHHSGASGAMLESNQVRPPSPLLDMAKKVEGRLDGGNRSPSPSLRGDSRDASFAGDNSAAAAAATKALLRTNSGTGQRPNIPKASTPRGAGSRAHSPAPKDGPPSAAGAASAQTPPAKVYATYEDIPRFYFGDGKPDSGRSATIAVPHYTRHENPHLKAFDGIAIPPAQLEQIKAAAAAAEAEKKANGGAAGGGASGTAPKKKKGAALSSDDTSPTKAASKEAANSESFSLSSIDPAAFAGLNIPQPGYRLAPMMPLTVMEDQDVATFIQREFAKVPAPPGPAPAPVAAPGGATRTPSAGAAGPKGARGLLGKKAAGPANGGAPANAAAIAAHAKAETAYRAALFQCMSNVTAQAYGLPRYFTAMVMRRLIADASAPPDSGAVTVTRSGGVGPKAVPSSSSSATPTPAVTVQCVEGVPVGVITAAAAKEFYDRHMRFCSPIRRMFVALVCCNLADGGVASSSSASAEGAGGGGGASSSASAGDAMSSILLPTTNFTEVQSLEIGGGPQSASTTATSTTTTTQRRRNYLLREDFVPYLDALLELHPGLAFLRQTADFQVKYVETILVRLFFECDVHDRGRISWPEFERSKLPDAIRQVEVAEDINAVLNFFSYEHFYVIYCRFWELDADRDMLIDANDLARYFQEGTANSKVIERIFQGHGRRLTAPPAAPTGPAAIAASAKKPLTMAAKRAAAAAAAADPAGIANKRMGYEDFVWFCLAEEDKASPRAIRYWFRILDLDADGVVCGWELEQFYACTRDAMIAITSEFISFEDIMCQIVDMVPALSEGHAALDRCFDRQRTLINANANVAKGTSSSASSSGGASAGGVPPPLPTASLSEKVRRRSSLASGPLGLPAPAPSAASSALPPHPPTTVGGAGKQAKAGGKASSPSSTTSSSPLFSAALRSAGDPRERYHRYGLTLRDLLASPEAAHVALNMVLNVAKFLMFEQRDPFVSHHDRLMGGYEGTEWDRFARMEYDRMAAEADE